MRFYIVNITTYITKPYRYYANLSRAVVLVILTKLWYRMVVILSEAKNLILRAEWRPFAPLRVT